MKKSKKIPTNKITKQADSCQKSARKLSKNKNEEPVRKLWESVKENLSKIIIKITKKLS